MGESGRMGEAGRAVLVMPYVGMKVGVVGGTEMEVGRERGDMMSLGLC